MVGRINTGRKIREKEEENVRAAGFFLWDGGEGFFGIFLELFFGFWKRRRIIYNLQTG